jgi:hypothetical protein
METQVLRDPRPHLLTIMAVALIIMVPLLFAFITMTDRLFWPESGIGTIAVWALLGIACGSLLVGLMVILARATRQSEAEHPVHDDGGL